MSKGWKTTDLKNHNDVFNWSIKHSSPNQNIVQGLYCVIYDRV